MPQPILGAEPALGLDKHPVWQPEVRRVAVLRGRPDVAEHHILVGEGWPLAAVSASNLEQKRSAAGFGFAAGRHLRLRVIVLVMAPVWRAPEPLVDFLVVGVQRGPEFR